MVNGAKRERGVKTVKKRPVLALSSIKNKRRKKKEKQELKKAENRAGSVSEIKVRILFDKKKWKKKLKDQWGGGKTNTGSGKKLKKRTGHVRENGDDGRENRGGKERDPGLGEIRPGEIKSRGGKGWTIGGRWVWGGGAIGTLRPKRERDGQSTLKNHKSVLLFMQLSL